MTQSTLAELDGSATTDDESTDENPPDDCACEDLGALPCFQCWLSGFETNPRYEEGI